MPRIQPVTETTPLLDAIKAKLGVVPNLFATIGQSPESLGWLIGGIEALGKAGMSAREIELVNIYTSELNGCGYCVSAHAMLGKKAGLAADDVERARIGDAATPREKAILAFVRRIVRTGGSGAGTELAQLREAGVSDRDVIEVLAHVAMKAFTNAVALVAQTEIDFPKAPRLPTP